MTRTIPIALLSNNEVKARPTGSAALAACLERIWRDLNEVRATGLADRSLDQQIIDIGSTLKRWKEGRG